MSHVSYLLILSNFYFLSPFGYNLFLLKTENWKHRSKIIFKYVNSVMNSAWTVHLSSAQWIHVKLLFIHTKKKEKCKKYKCEPKNVNPNTHFIYSTFSKS